MIKLGYIYKRRWQKLFAFLSELPRRKFNFATWGVDEYENSVQPNFKNCNTKGCVAGWLPTIFKNQWKWEGDVPIRRGSDSRYTEPKEEFSEFFGIDMRLAFKLIIPEDDPISPEDDPISGINIKSDVTPKQWMKEAKRILKKNGVDAGV